MMQLLSYFDLRINGETVNYKLYRDAASKKYYFRTLGITLRYPDFSAWREQGDWVFDNMRDEAVQAQAISEIRQVSGRQSRPIL